jgi:plastocyanin
MKFKEMLAALSVVVSLVAIPVAVGWYHNNFVLDGYPEANKVFTLSAVTESGVWTLDKVDGTNYWWKDFKPATIFLEEGDKVVLRFESTDVHHRFYCPELNIGPIEVEPGHIEIVEFEAIKSGTYSYFCTSMCGECHFYMKGWIVVTVRGQTPRQPEEESIICKHNYDKPSETDMIAWGRYLYYKNACITCHGNEGEGGIENINYVKGEVPAHDILADKLWLKEKEHADIFVEMLKNHIDFEDLEEEPDIPLFNLVLTQYYAAKDLIKNGKHCAKADAEGPEPPLQMLSWQALLTDRDIDSIIAYLITLYEWEEEEE